MTAFTLCTFLVPKLTLDSHLCGGEEERGGALEDEAGAVHLCAPPLVPTAVQSVVARCKENTFSES